MSLTETLSNVGEGDSPISLIRAVVYVPQDSVSRGRQRMDGKHVPIANKQVDPSDELTVGSV